MTLNLTKPEIFVIVREIIAAELDVALPKLIEEVLIDDIVDEREIDLPVIIIECEREFGVDISDEEMENLETVEELVDLLYEKVLDNKNEAF